MRYGEVGSTTLAALVLLLACSALTSVAVTAALESAKEHNAHHDVLCARFAALAGLALGPSHDGIPAAVASEVQSLTIRAFRDSLGRCAVSAQAGCGGAVRTLTHVVDDPAACPP